MDADARAVATTARPQRAPGTCAEGASRRKTKRRTTTVFDDDVAAASFFVTRQNQRLLNWKRLRAPGRPYFLRSTLRASRVRSPAFFSGERSFSSARHNARASP